MIQNLEGLSILVTRPKPQGENLCLQIDKLGGHSIYFPTIEITPSENRPLIEQQIAKLNQYQWIIFISPQAVYHSAPLIKAHWPEFPPDVKVASVGGGTAGLLNKAHLPLHVYPLANWNSEGLLQLPFFQEIRGEKIALIRGEGGRPYLAEVLTTRGAVLTHIIVYKRNLPSVDPRNYIHLLNQHKIDIIVATSCEILDNLIRLIGKDAGDNLHRVPLIVISERMVHFADKKGFTNIFLAKNASDDAIITMLIQKKDYVCQMQKKIT